MLRRLRVTTDLSYRVIVLVQSPRLSIIRDYEATRLRDNETTRLRGYETTRLPDYQTSRHSANLQRTAASRQSQPALLFASDLSLLFLGVFFLSFFLSFFAFFPWNFTTYRATPSRHPSGFPSLFIPLSSSVVPVLTSSPSCRWRWAICPLSYSCPYS